MQTLNTQPSKHTTTDQQATLQRAAQACRLSIIEMHTAAQSAHLGSSLSVVDILVTLYHGMLDVDLIKQQRPERDYVILSKGHAASALYATLSSVGVIPNSMLADYYRGVLAGHPTRTPALGIEASTGSLGHGLPIAIGLALAAKHDGRRSHVYVIVSDGECQEGSTWEALVMAARFKLNNLTIIVDDNGLQAFDRTHNIMTVPLARLFAAAGANVHHVDGHDHTALLAALTPTQAPTLAAGPTAIIAKTIKGKGLSFAQDKLEWHYRSLKPELYAQARRELE